MALSGCYGANFAGGEYDTLPSLDVVNGSDAGGDAAAAQEGESVDVVVTGGQDQRCTFANDNFKARAKALLDKGIDAGFGNFPIDRNKFSEDLSRTLLSYEAICHVLTTQPVVTASNYEQLLAEYKEGSLSSQDAYTRGMIAVRVPIEARCPSNVDWAHSDSYNSVNDCSEVTNQVKNGIPVNMYATRGRAEAVQAYVSQRKVQSLITTYAKGGPIPCGSGPGFEDSYRSIPILPIWNVNFVLRSIETPGSGWTAWMLRRSCTADDGAKYEADDLMFAFGMRTYIPLIVEADGRREAYTIIASAAVGASNNAFAGLVSEETRVNRLNASEFTQFITILAGVNRQPAHQKSQSIKPAAQ